MEREITSLELALLEALRASRVEFFDRILAHARKHAATKGEMLSNEQEGYLRSPHAYQIAEFFYLAAEYGIFTEDRVRELLDKHNKSLKEITADKDKRERNRLLKNRGEEAEFTADQIEALVNAIDGSGRLRLDQTSLGKLLGELMSPEKCRTVVEALEIGGLLERRRISGGAKLVAVTHNRHLEDYFREHLVAVIRKIKMELP